MHSIRCAKKFSELGKRFFCRPPPVWFDIFILLTLAVKNKISNTLLVGCVELIIYLQLLIEVKKYYIYGINTYIPPYPEASHAVIPKITVPSGSRSKYDVMFHRPVASTSNAMCSLTRHDPLTSTARTKP